MSNKKKNTEDYAEDIKKGIEEIQTTEKYKEFLQFLSKNHRYSFRNQILAKRQNPHATLFKGYKQWGELGRQVQKGEKAIKILAPFIKKEIVKGENNKETVYKRAYFGTVSVFDVSQTTGKELPTILENLTGESKISKIILKNIDLIEKELETNISFEAYKGASNGYCQTSIRNIVINNNNSLRL